MCFFTKKCLDTTSECVWKIWDILKVFTKAWYWKILENRGKYATIKVFAATEESVY